MTEIAIQDGSVVMRDGQVGTGQACCCGGACEVCPRCAPACLQAVFAGWSGTSSGCSCDELNGTYVLTRGPGARPTVTATLTDSTGTGATLTVVLGFDSTRGVYFIQSVTVVEAGSDYSEETAVTLSISGGVVSCGDAPAISVQQERREPEGLSMEIILGSLGSGSGAITAPVWAPQNVTPGSETWKVDSVTVSNGGTLYDEYEQVRVVVTTPAEISAVVESFDGFVVVDHAEPVIQQVSIATVSGSGAVLSIAWEIDDTVTDFLLGQNPGSDSRHWRIASVTVANPGSGYANGEQVSFSLSGRHIDYGMGLADASYVLGFVSVNGSGGITGTSWTLGSSAVLYKSNGVIQRVQIEDAGEYYKLSGIIGATVENPGSIAPVSGGNGSDDGSGGNACEYSICQQVSCGEEEESCRRISVTIGEEEHTLTVEKDGTVIASGTIPASGNSCSDMTFLAESITTDCSTAGSVAITGVACGAEPSGDECCTPPPCSGPCEDSEDCAPGCACVDGECVAVACCLPDGTCIDGVPQEECEECVPSFVCYDEETFEPSPVVDCSECTGYCEQGGSEGLCGISRIGKACNENPCDCTIDGFSSLGWYTNDSRDALSSFLSDAGYERIRFTPVQFFPGFDPNYVSPCGYTFGRIEADCCGATGDCTPATITRNIVVGTGGPFIFSEPCQGVDRTEDFTLTVCCPFP